MPLNLDQIPLTFEENLAQGRHRSYDSTFILIGLRGSSFRPLMFHQSEFVHRYPHYQKVVKRHSRVDIIYHSSDSTTNSRVACWH